MSDEARAIKRGSVVRYQGMVCLVLWVDAANACIRPPGAPDEWVSLLECEPTEMTLATPGSRAYWAGRGKGVLAASEGDDGE